MACIALSISVIAYLMLIISVCYFITFSVIAIQFLRKSRVKDYSEHPRVKISVVIAARNEKVHLPRLLGDLKIQSYAADLFDIIIADDHSDQDIASLPEIKDLDLHNLTVVELPDSFFGKKAALKLAAEQSKSELLLFTDADCRVPGDWIMKFAAKYQQVHPSLIIGMVDSPKQKGFLKNFFRHEFISLIVSGIGTASLGFPTLCNGANLAVRRDVYHEFANQMQTNIPSGDDVFLLHHVKKNKEKVVTIKDRDSIVSTSVPKGIGEFLNQRARWASKAVLYNDFPTIYLVLLVTITNLLFVICLFHLIADKFSMVYATTIILKIIADYSVVIAGLYFFQGKRSLIWLPFFQLLYPIYLLVSLTMGVFKIYQWKGRKYY